ncbi:MAG: hypothetical protein H6598_03270 [Flavobacteriales bacterium]|nr:hypothetical protein [Flavobacteriales bacterium]
MSKIKFNQIDAVIQNDELRITIIQARPRMSAILFMFILIVIGLLLPLFILFNFGELRKGGIVALLIFWGTSIYFIRILLWNLYGKEVFILSKNKIKHYFDYKYFRDSVSEISFETIEIELLNLENEIRADDDLIDTPVQAHINLRFRFILNDQHLTAHLESPTFKTLETKKVIVDFLDQHELS